MFYGWSIWLSSIKDWESLVKFTPSELTKEDREQAAWECLEKAELVKGMREFYRELFEFCY